MTDSSSLRAGDADRDRTISQLREAFAQGRLTEDEFEQRMAAATSARTFADLDALTTDLPGASAAVPTGALTTPTATPVPTDPAPVPARQERDRIKAMWASWAGVSLLMIVIWGASWISSGSLQGFWPIWVIGPWGAVNVIATLNRN